MQSEVQTQLTDMGFDADVVKLAYSRATIKTVEGLINFIEQNPSIEADSKNPEIMANLDKQPQQREESEGESISAHVNQDFVAKLIELGHSKDVAERRSS